MELKKIYLFIIVILFSNKLNSEIINPNKKLLPYDVVKIQLEALKNNNKNDEGIKQTWLFAHPDNKKIVTLVWKFEKFYKAETYHQDYYEKNFIRYLMYKKGSQREEILKKIWN